MNLGPSEMGSVFMVCGAVMAGAQGGVVGWLIDDDRSVKLLAYGYILMGASLVFLMPAESMMWVLVLTGSLALGMALILPTLAALISKIAGPNTGTVLGVQNAVNSLGLAMGPLTGGLLFSLSIHLPYLLTAGFLLASALLMLKMKRLSIDQRSAPA